MCFIRQMLKTIAACIWTMKIILINFDTLKEVIFSEINLSKPKHFAFSENLFS